MGRRHVLMPWTGRPGALVAATITGLLLLSQLQTAPCRAAGGSPPFWGNPGLSLTIGGHLFAEESMRDTYGPTAEVGLRLWTQPVERTRFFIGARYLSATGDAVTGDPTFTSSMESKLEALPVELGFLTDMVPEPAFALLFGVAAEAVWAREQVAGASYLDPSEERRYTGWSAGIRFLFGPEWRWSGGRYALGLETSTGLSHVDVSARDSMHGVNLSSLAARGTVSVSL